MRRFLWSLVFSTILSVSDSAGIRHFKGNQEFEDALSWTEKSSKNMMIVHFIDKAWCGEGDSNGDSGNEYGNAIWARAIRAAAVLLRQQGLEVKIIDVDTADQKNTRIIRKYNVDGEWTCANYVRLFFDGKEDGFIDISEPHAFSVEKWVLRRAVGIRATRIAVNNNARKEGEMNPTELLSRFVRNSLKIDHHVCVLGFFETDGQENLGLVLMDQLAKAMFRVPMAIIYNPVPKDEYIYDDGVEEMQKFAKLYDVKAPAILVLKDFGLIRRSMRVPKLHAVPVGPHHAATKIRPQTASHSEQIEADSLPTSLEEFRQLKRVIRKAVLGTTFALSLFSGQNDHSSRPPKAIAPPWDTVSSQHPVWAASVTQLMTNLELGGAGVGNDPLGSLWKPPAGLTASAETQAPFTRIAALAAQVLQKRWPSLKINFQFPTLAPEYKTMSKLPIPVSDPALTQSEKELAQTRAAREAHEEAVAVVDERTSEAYTRGLMALLRAVNNATDHELRARVKRGLLPPPSLTLSKSALAAAALQEAEDAEEAARSAKAAKQGNTRHKPHLNIRGVKIQNVQSYGRSWIETPIMVVFGGIICIMCASTMTRIRRHANLAKSG